MMEFSEDAAFWVFNQVSNFAYTRYSDMIVDIQEVQKKLEKGYIDAVPFVDRAASEMYASNPRLAREFLTRFSVDAGNHTVAEWKKLYRHLFTKYLDGNIKEPSEKPEDHKYVNPRVQYPGYGEEWYRMIVKETGDKFLYLDDTGGH